MTFLEKIRQLMSEVDPMAWIIGINQILSLVEKIRSLVKKRILANRQTLHQDSKVFLW